MKPVFMIGTRHSGSDLLRLMLVQLPEIAAPHPPHILQRFMPLVPAYGDLADDANFGQLVEDVCRLVELNPAPWEGIVLDRSDVARRCGTRDLVAIHGAVYDIYAAAKGAETWCCKSPSNINYVPQIERYFPGPKYIYLYRDGRDVAVSFRKAVAGEKHFYHIAREWADTQRLAFKLRCEIDPARFLSVSYEALTGDPAGTARTVCRFLGLPYRESMLDCHRTGEAKRAALSSERCVDATGPVTSGNSRTFLRKASELDIRIFESVAGPVLDALRYERAFVKRGEEHPFTEADIRIFDAENAERKDALRKLVDPADQMRRDLQAGLLKAVRERQAVRTNAAKRCEAILAGRSQAIAAALRNKQIET